MSQKKSKQTSSASSAPDSAAIQQENNTDKALHRGRKNQIIPQAAQQVSDAVRDGGVSNATAQISDAAMYISDASTDVYKSNSSNTSSSAPASGLFSKFLNSRGRSTKPTVSKYMKDKQTQTQQLKEKAKEQQTDKGAEKGL